MQQNKEGENLLYKKHIFVKSIAHMMIPIFLALI